MLPNADVDLFMDALAEVRLGVLTGIGIEVLADMNANSFAVVMTAVGFSIETTLEGFSR